MVNAAVLWWWRRLCKTNSQYLSASCVCCTAACTAINRAIALSVASTHPHTRTLHLAQAVTTFTQQSVHTLGKHTTNSVLRALKEHSYTHTRGNSPCCQFSPPPPPLLQPHQQHPEEQQPQLLEASCQQVNLYRRLLLPAAASLKVFAFSYKWEQGEAAQGLQETQGHCWHFSYKCSVGTHCW